ncbi:MAG: protein translocase subunit SecD [Oscillospiraceae bacterium]|nr:protein translocase subunit SecD [Oscillospiraceae bacterium]
MKKSVITLVIVVLVVAGLLFTALHGISYTKTTPVEGSTNETATGESATGEASTDKAAVKKEKVYIIEPVSEGVVLGLDLVGGSEITYEAVIPEDFDESNLSDGMEVARTMLQQRLDSLGYTEASCYISGERRLVVEIPSVEDPEKAVRDLGATAVVNFVDADGTVWLTGSDIDDAEYEYSPTDSTGINRPHVRLDLTSEGRKKLYEASVKVLARTDGKNYLAIQMDNEEISAPYVNSTLDTDSVVITIGAESGAEEEARYLAKIIAAGRLPFELTTAKQQTIGASLGEKSLSTSLLAGLIGLILVMIFMIVVYRLMGVISCIALVTYASLFAVAISVLHVNLSLPGIAGIILTVGMAVDANVIIFERVKEELRLGKTLRFAIESGYKRAMLAIIDANVTTMIAGFVLLWQGSGTILGFAVTLLIGVALSMLVMLVMTKLLLKTAVGLKITNLKLYCA